MIDDAERSLARWLGRPAEGWEDCESMVQGFGERLVEAGTAVHRMSISFMTSHPEVWARNVTWVHGVGAKTTETPYAVRLTSGYAGSPVEAIHGGSREIRQRLDVQEASIPYPQLHGLRREGLTDYLILSLPVGIGVPSYASFSTSRPGGFGDEALAALRGIGDLLALRVALLSARVATRSLLQTYLGGSAAERVMAGAVSRAAGAEIHAAILFCDLRGFTTLSDSRPAIEIVQLLDEYFDCVAGPVHDNGGEVLKFIGDAMLATFPTDPASPALACARAIAAAESGFDTLAARMPETRAGFSIHAGPVLFGNIGSRTRLDFTVIGAAVNEASRVQGLCKDLAVPLLVTDVAVDGVQRTDLVPLGKHALRGVREPRGVFTLRRFAGR